MRFPWAPRQVTVEWTTPGWARGGSQGKGRAQGLGSNGAGHSPLSSKQQIPQLDSGRYTHLAGDASISSTRQSHARPGSTHTHALASPEETVLP